MFPQLSPVTTPKPVWGDGVKFLRELHGLTQTDLAAKAGTQQTVISKVERGARRISDGLRLRIARALNVDPYELFPYIDDAA